MSLCVLEINMEIDMKHYAQTMTVSYQLINYTFSFINHFFWGVQSLYLYGNIYRILTITESTLVVRKLFLPEN